MAPALDFGFVKFTADKAFDIENGILGVGMEHILCAIIDTDIDRPIRVVSKERKKERAYLLVVIRRHRYAGAWGGVIDLSWDWGWYGQG